MCQTSASPDRYRFGSKSVAGRGRLNVDFAGKRFRGAQPVHGPDARELGVFCCSVRPSRCRCLLSVGQQLQGHRSCRRPIVRRRTANQPDAVPAFTQPMVRFDLDRMDDNDNPLFGVTAEIAWTPKPAYQLTVRTPLYAVRHWSVLERKPAPDLVRGGNRFA